MLYRNYFLLTAITVSVFSFTHAQIPNAGFENWTSTGFPAHLNPDNWGTLNDATGLAGVYTCERGSGADVHSGNYSMKLTSKSVFGQSAPGIAVTGTINTGTQELEGGFPYTQRPVAMRGWYKYSPMPGDSAEIRVTLWRRSGGVREEVGEGVIHPTTTVTSFTQFSVPITYTSADNPDSAMILLVSTNTNNIQVGSAMIIDDLAFLDCSGFSVSVSTTDVTTVGGSDGTATANITGGTPPFSYMWGNAAIVASITNLSSGTYCVTVTDVNGCTATACGAVNEPGCTGFSVTMSGTLASPGGNDGTATATPAGGTPPYAYQWSNGMTVSTIDGLTAGQYCVTVTDSIGCIAIGCYDVTEPDCSSFALTLNVTDATNDTTDDGIIVAAAAGGTLPYFYTWSIPGVDSFISGLGAGYYCVTVS
ncbi:MAG TPA: hypothetical protein VNJ07_07910, partial [Chitinophagales bacterium]|nr:hypothetical protein [Chitinophagales bacterium]